MLVAFVLLSSWAAQTEDQSDILKVFDFSIQPKGPEKTWLSENGFTFDLDFDSLTPEFTGEALRLTAKKPTAGITGFIFPEGKEVQGVNSVRITWGIEKFPKGADWKTGNNRVAVALMISFGQERISSGLPLGIYVAPYFIGIFPSETEKHNSTFIGKLWKRGGRYLSINENFKGGKTSTIVELDERFKTLFQLTQTLPVSAIGIQVNSKDTEGIASAYIEKIEFLSSSENPTKEIHEIGENRQ